MKFPALALGKNIQFQDQRTKQKLDFCVSITLLSLKLGHQPCFDIDDQEVDIDRISGSSANMKHMKTCQLGPICIQFSGNNVGSCQLSFVETWFTKVDKFEIEFLNFECLIRCQQNQCFGVQ